MKKFILFLLIIPVLTLADNLRAQGTAFTYQGQLQSSGSVANGTFDFEFALYTTNNNGAIVAGPVTNSATGVTNGLFVTIIDFGPAVFVGSNYWLDIAVRTNGGTMFTELTPRQPVTPTPYAIFATTASNWSGSVALSQLPAGVVTNNESNVTLSNLSINGGLTLPAFGATLFAGTSLLLYQDNAANFYAGANAGNRPAAVGAGNNTGIGDQALQNNTGAENTAVGNGALINQSGNGNTAIGTQTLAGNTGNNNTAEGSLALSTSTGSFNTANGANALSDNLGGSFNTASGANALENNRNGNYNTADGYDALYSSFSNPNGSFNTAQGYQALFNSSTGSSNTASGNAALYANTTGNNNIALGAAAGYNLTTGSGNIDIGNPGTAADANLIRIGANQSQSFISGVINGNGGGLTNLNASNLVGTLPSGQLPSSVVTTNETGVTFGSLTLNGAPSFLSPATIYSGLNSLLYSDTNGNFFAGLGAGDSTFLLSGVDNTAIGNQAMVNNTSGSYNTAVGDQALYYGSTGADNTALGYQALSSKDGPFATVTGSGNTAIGFQSLALDTTGSGNTACGIYAIYFNTSGSNNTATGNSALGANTNGSGNTADGFQALASIQSGQFNVALGFDAFQSLDSGIYNTAVGTYAGHNASADNGLVAIGFGALANDEAQDIGSVSGNGENTAVGYQALQDDSVGYANTAVGYLALLNNDIGIDNTAIGDMTLTANQNGYENTAVGYGALGALQNEYNNIAIGYNAGIALVSGANNIYIGNAGLSSDNGVVRIGTTGTQSQTYLAGTVNCGSMIGSTITATGTAYCQVLSITSDRNAKENFAAVNPQDMLAKVAALPLSRWNYKTDRQDNRHIGPMAQDFQAAFNLNGEDNKHISMADEGGVALAAIQGLNQKLEKAQAENTELKLQNDTLAKRLNDLEKAVQALGQNK